MTDFTHIHTPDCHVELRNSRSTTLLVVSAGIFHQQPTQPFPVSTKQFPGRAEPLCLPGMPPVAGMTYSTGDDLGFDLMHHPYLNCGIPDVLQFGLPGSDQYNSGCYVSSEHEITCLIVAANGGQTLFFLNSNECVFILNNKNFFFKLSGGTSRCLWINFYMIPSVSLRLVVDK